MLPAAGVMSEGSHAPRSRDRGVVHKRGNRQRYRFLVDEDVEAVVMRELSLLTLDVRSDPTRLLALLHRDFMEYGASGRVWDRTSILSITIGDVEQIGATEVRAHRLGPDAVLVTYVSDSGGRVALRSSTWLREAGTWLLRFHQGTLIAQG